MSTTASESHGSYLMPSLRHATVADAMHPGIVSCHPDAPLTEVARTMGILSTLDIAGVVAWGEA
jgi:CBS domain-containing protein